MKWIMILGGIVVFFIVLNALGFPPKSDQSKAIELCSQVGISNLNDCAKLIEMSGKRR